MCYYSAEYFTYFMEMTLGVIVEEDQVGEETVILSKEELDEELIPENLNISIPEQILMNSCIYSEESKEWVVCVASDFDTDQPLFLICILNGEKIYEEVLISINGYKD